MFLFFVHQASGLGVLRPTVSTRMAGSVSSCIPGSASLLTRQNERALSVLIAAVTVAGESGFDEDSGAEEDEDEEDLGDEDELDENDLRDMLGDSVGKMLEIVVKDAMDGGNSGVFLIKEGNENELDDLDGDDGSEEDPRLAALRAARGESGNGKKKKKSKRGKNKDAQADVTRAVQDFDLTPREIVEHLDRFVIRQSEAKKCLAVAVCDHYNRIRRMLADPTLADRDYQKPNILLLGPTGVGKTYLMRNIAKLIGVPLVKADATKFTETGYVGEDAEDLVRELISKANGNIALAQYGMIYVDEVDKIAAVANDGAERGGVNSRNVQNNFLKILEDTDVSVANQRSQMMMGLGGPSKSQKMSTRNILFIFSGAFNNLNEELRRKHDTQTIGFAVQEDEVLRTSALDAKITPHREATPFGITGEEDASTSTAKNVDKSYLRLAETSDFIRCGLEPEFIGRIPVRVTCDPLSEQALFEVLTQSEHSVLHQYEEDFKGYNIDMECDDHALKEVARQAWKEKTGARGLLTVLERSFRDFKYELPSTPITSLKASLRTIQNPQRELIKLMKTVPTDDEAMTQAELLRWTLPLLRTHEVSVSFSDEAVQRVHELACDGLRRRSARLVVQQRLAGLPDVLKRISARTGAKAFVVSLEMVNDPKATMEKWQQATEDEDGADELPCTYDQD